MQSGKAMCVNPKKLFEWVTPQMTSGARKVVLITSDGQTETGWLASILTPGARSIEGFEPHWATCAQRDMFKKGGGQ